MSTGPLQKFTEQSKTVWANHANRNEKTEWIGSGKYEMEDGWCDKYQNEWKKYIPKGPYKYPKPVRDDINDNDFKDAFEDLIDTWEKKQKDIDSKKPKRRKAETTPEVYHIKRGAVVVVHHYNGTIETLIIDNDLTTLKHDKLEWQQQSQMCFHYPEGQCYYIINTDDIVKTETK